MTGRILKTTDAGNNWTVLSTGTTNDLFGIFFIDLNHGYVVGDNIILKTTNGGTSWSIISSSISGISIYFNSTTTGYIGSQNGYIYKTTNGGTSWASNNLGSYQSVNKILFNNDSVGYLSTGLTYSSRGKIYKTSTFGKYWEPMPSSDDSLMLLDVFFKSDMEGFVVGDSGRIKHTTNAGGFTKPVANFTSNTTAYCQGDSAIFYNQTNPNCTFSWLLNDTIISSTYNLRIKLANATTNTMTLIANNGSASDTAIMVFKVGKKLTSIPIDCKALKDSICDGSSATIQVFNSDSTVAYTFNNGASVKGNGGTLNLTTGALGVKYDPNFCCMYYVPTTYVYTIEATKKTACNTISSQLNYTITVFPSPSESEQSYTLALTSLYTTYCQNDTAQIILQNSSQGWHYQLTEYNGGRKAGRLISGTGANITLLGDSLNRYSNINQGDIYGGEYLTRTIQYYVVATDEVGCTSSLGTDSYGNSPYVITDTINNFEPNFDIVKWGLYPNDTLTFKKAIPNDISSFKWDLPGSSILTSVNSLPQNVTYASTGDYPITLIAKSRSGNCIDSIQKIENIFNQLPGALTGDYCWEGVMIDSTNDKTILAQCVDKFGNIYISGYEPENLDYPNESYYFFLTKIDRYGNVIWKTQCDNYTDPIVFGNTLTTDSMGNVYVGGSFNTLDIISINGDTIFNKTTRYGDAPNAFLFKFDKTGKFVWAILDSTDHNDNLFGSGISDILIDNNQNIYFAANGVTNLKFTDGKDTSFYGYFSIIKINTDGKYLSSILAKFPENNALSNGGSGYTTYPIETRNDYIISGIAYSEFPKIKMTSKGQIVVAGHCFSINNSCYAEASSGL